jgi:hypothetical protein
VVRFRSILFSIIQQQLACQHEKQKDASMLNEDQRAKIASQAELEAELVPHCTAVSQPRCGRFGPLKNTECSVTTQRMC